jgi:DNA-binding NtrC family response regulator
MMRLLLVEDDPSIREAVRRFFALHGFVVDAVEGCAHAIERAKRSTYATVVLDHHLVDGTSSDLLPELRRMLPQATFVVLTGHASIDLAVQSIKGGAAHFLQKPIELPRLLETVRSHMSTPAPARGWSSQRLRAVRPVGGLFAGQSRAIRELEALARRVAEADAPVLVNGETGSGKSAVARWIHEHSPRASATFVDLNCAGLARELVESELFGYERGAFTGAQAAKAGLLERADRGTLFLDEIGDLDLTVQPKLLKALEEQRFRRMGDLRDRSVDVRLIAATHKELAELVERRLFREDLYFRINIVRIVVPPLRDRREDILVIARSFLDIMREASQRDLVLTTEAEELLVGHDWPGNVRELRNVLERAAVLSGDAVLDRSHIRFDERPRAGSRALVEATPEITRAPASPARSTSPTLRELEREHVETILREEDGHVERAARRLGMGRSSLYKKLKRWGIAR